MSIVCHFWRFLDEAVNASCEFGKKKNHMPLWQNKFACCPDSKTSNILTPSRRLERNQRTPQLEIIYRLNNWITRPHILRLQPVFKRWTISTKQKFTQTAWRRPGVCFFFFTDKYHRSVVYRPDLMTKFEKLWRRRWLEPLKWPWPLSYIDF